MLKLAHVRRCAELALSVSTGLAIVFGVPSIADAKPLPGVPVYAFPGAPKAKIVTTPKTLEPFNDLYFTNVRFTKRTATYANATAVLHENICEPSCADGKMKTSKAWLTFRVPTSAKVPYFNCLRYHLAPSPSKIDGDWETWNIPISSAYTRTETTDGYGGYKSRCGYDFTTGG